MRVLLICYDIHPLKGGESSVAWHVSTRLAKFVNVTVLTRPNNIEASCKKASELGLNIEFQGFDLPYFLRRLKNILPGGIFLYCVLWQYILAKKLKFIKRDYDIIHSVNFVSDTIPSFIFRLDARTVWGPISHHEPMPYELVDVYTFLRMQVKLLARRFLWILFSTKSKRRKFDLVLYSNKSVTNRLGDGDNIRYWPSTGVIKNHDILQSDNATKKVLKIVYAARMVDIKGWPIIVDLIEKLCVQNNPKRVHFDLIGDGPLLSKVTKALDKCLSSNISWKLHRKLSHEHYLKILADSDIYVCPSFEGGGIAVAEAMSFNLPIVCFDNYGPGETVGENYVGLVRANSERKFSSDDFVQKVQEMIANNELRLEASLQSDQRVIRFLDWDVKIEMLLKDYQNILGK